MAVDLVLSLRRWHQEPFCLVADAVCAAHVEQRFRGVFDDVVSLPPRYKPGHACKFALAEATPYRHNLFIDADTLVLAPLTQLLDDAAGAPFQMMGTQRTRETTETHHGFAIPALIDEFGLERYFDNHSGAFTFERDYGRALLGECFDVYVNALYKPWRRLRGRVGDELAFGIVGGRRGMARMREPYPVLWTAELAALRPHDTHKPLCHFIASPAPAALDWLMAEVTSRRQARGLPLGSEAVWRGKARRSDRRARLGEQLIRLRDTLLRPLRTRGG